MMELTVNGEPLAHEGPGVLIDILKQIGADPAHVAVMVNNRVVRRDQMCHVTVQNGDRLDVLTLARGG